MNICPYCEGFEKGFEYGNKILYESDNFAVFPSLGQIVEGYLLIAPKKHHIAMGEIASKFYPELNSVCQKVKEVLSKNYESPLFYFSNTVQFLKQKEGVAVLNMLIFMPSQLKQIF